MPSPTDMAHLEYLLVQGALFDLQKRDYLNLGDLTTVSIVACSDCDCTPEYERHLCKMAGVRPGDTEHQRAFRPHRHYRHGGPLQMASDLLIPFDSERATWMKRLLLDEITEGMQLKASRTLVLVPHFPCGKARAHGFATLSSVLELFITAAEVATKHFNGCTRHYHQLHVVKDECMRTYGIDIFRLRQMYFESPYHG